MKMFKNIAFFTIGMMALYSCNSNALTIKNGSKLYDIQFSFAEPSVAAKNPKYTSVLKRGDGWYTSDKSLPRILSVRRYGVGSELLGFTPINMEGVQVRINQLRDQHPQLMNVPPTRLVIVDTWTGWEAYPEFEL